MHTSFFFPSNFWVIDFVTPVTFLCLFLSIEVSQGPLWFCMQLSWICIQNYDDFVFSIYSYSSTTATQNLRLYQLSPTIGFGCSTESPLTMSFSGNFVISYFVVTLSTRLLQSKQRSQTVFNDSIFSHYAICRSLKIENCKYYRHEITMHLVTNR